MNRFRSNYANISTGFRQVVSDDLPIASYAKAGQIRDVAAVYGMVPPWYKYPTDITSQMPSWMISAYNGSNKWQ
jgi:hypothetical protein